jgi:hypothetical protein
MPTLLPPPPHTQPPPPSPHPPRTTRARRRHRTTFSFVHCPRAGRPADDPLVAAIAQQFLTDREAHDKTAAEWAKRYASA